jgi:prevent-host-death family protein
VIAAGKFKATCLQLLDRAAAGETITITKRGKAVGRLVPPAQGEPKAFVPLRGRMEGMVEVKGDIVGPHFDWWQKK